MPRIPIGATGHPGQAFHHEHDQHGHQAPAQQYEDQGHGRDQPVDHAFQLTDVRHDESPQGHRHENGQPWFASHAAHGHDDHHQQKSHGGSPGGDFQQQIGIETVEVGRRSFEPGGDGQAYGAAHGKKESRGQHPGENRLPQERVAEFQLRAAQQPVQRHEHGRPDLAAERFGGGIHHPGRQAEETAAGHGWPEIT